MDWLRRKPEWVSASDKGWARLPPSRANTLRSVRHCEYLPAPRSIMTSAALEVQFFIRQRLTFFCLQLSPVRQQAVTTIQDWWGPAGLLASAKSRGVG